MRKRDIRIFLTSFVLSTLICAGVGAAFVWARAASWSQTSVVASPTVGAATVTPSPATTGETIPTAVRPTQTPASSTPQPTPALGVTQVVIRSYLFAPATIQVPVGTTVTWTNRDQAAHTVTLAHGKVDSGMLKTGQSFHYTFTSPGTFSYICVYHPGMTGTVVVTP